MGRNEEGELTAMGAPRDAASHAAWRERLRESHLRRLGEPEARFWSKVEKTPGCWFWRGAVFRHGYGQFKIRQRVLQAHRLAWGFSCGDIPAGLWVLHRCDTPLCVRPEHLFLGTARDNARDSVAKGRAVIITNNPMNSPVSRERLAARRRGVPRPFMARGEDGRYVGLL